MIISAYEYQCTNEKYYSTVIEGLDDAAMSIEKAKEIPSLVFMLPSFATYETASQITRVVDQLSQTYFQLATDQVDLLACSALSMGWARADCYNEEMLDAMSD